MLSPLCFRVISDPSQLPTLALRLLLRLIADYDLTHFVVLRPSKIKKDYSLNARIIAVSWAQLRRAGILEPGPMAPLRGSSRRFRTYRIRPAYLLTPEALQQWFRDMRERRERETLLTSPQAPAHVE